MQQGRDREALEHLVAARAAFDDLRRRNPEAVLYERKRVKAISGLADLHGKMGQRSAACAEYREALALSSRLRAAGRFSASDQNELESRVANRGRTPYPLGYPYGLH